MSGVTGIANHCKTKPRPDIKSIGDDIMNALHRSWYFDDNIKVSADGGKVHLTGNVDTWNERQTAASTAWASAGTTSVINDIHIN